MIIRTFHLDKMDLNLDLEGLGTIMDLHGQLMTEFILDKDLTN